MKNKKSIVLLSGIVLTLILTLSISYAFFYYVQEGEEITLTSGSISINFSEGTNYISLGNSYPKSDIMGKIDPNYYDFTVSGSKGENDDILYEIQIEEEEGNTLDEKYVKVYLTDQDNEFVALSPHRLNELPISQYNGKRVVYEEFINNSEQTHNYRLRFWIDENYSENIETLFKFKVNLYAKNEKFVSLYEILDDNLSSKFLKKDDIAKYIYGRTTETINNYVWYSGKLWRVVALNNDGTIKLITEHNMTSMFYNDLDTFSDSWVYQWLNEDFLSTLYNYKKLIVTDYEWDISITNSALQKPDRTLLVQAPVGLLNSYERYQSYNGVNQTTSYLNNGYCWWLLNSYNGQMYYSNDEGNLQVSGSSWNSLGIRPVINLTKNVRIRDGNGTKEEPYRIVGDIFNSKQTEKLNNRISGEYIKFDNELYRIVNTNDEKTKIVKVNYIRDDNGEIMMKKLFSSKYYGENISVNKEYWDNYLNNYWITSINNDYRKMIVKGVWYLGNNDYSNYKDAVCVDNDTNESTRKCKKVSNVYSGYVGVARLGEIFAISPMDASDQSYDIWTLTPRSNNVAWRIFNNGYATAINANTSLSSVLPQLFLSTNVYITSGSGTLQDPFEIAMD